MSVRVGVGGGGCRAGLLPILMDLNVTFELNAAQNYYKYMFSSH